jgi:hypothetical protein
MDDYHEKVAFQFIHPKDNGKKYSRHYERPAYSGLAELRVGRFRTANDYAVVIINIATETYEPYLVLEDYKPAFSNADILAEIVDGFVEVHFISGHAAAIEGTGVAVRNVFVYGNRSCVSARLLLALHVFFKFIDEQGRPF